MAVEFGMGSSLRAESSTSACVRAVKDALWHNSLTIAQAFDQSVDQMIVDVELACPNPASVDLDEVRAVFPYGDITVKASDGGLSVPKPGGGVTLVAHAAIVVSLNVEWT